jgi:hypothetical protein
LAGGVEEAPEDGLDDVVSVDQRVDILWQLFLGQCMQPGRVPLVELVRRRLAPGPDPAQQGVVPRRHVTVSFI